MRGARELRAAERLGAAEVEALSVVDAEVGEQPDGFLVADELGDCAFAHAGGDVDCRFEQQSVSFAGAAVLDELTVDLEKVEGKVFEVVERAVTGAEVIQREPAAELVEVADELAGPGHVDDRSGLGDLEDQAVGCERRCA